MKASERYVKEAEKIVARKEYKNNIPLVGTSSHENVNIELAFMTLAHLIDKTKTRPKIIPFSEAVKHLSLIVVRSGRKCCRASGNFFINDTSRFLICSSRK
jgi:hypothetical protein